MLEVATILEKNGDEYYNDIPIDYETMTFTKSESSIKSWKKNNKIEEDATVEEVIEYFKKKYEIKTNEISEIGKIIALRHEISTNVYTSYKPVLLAKNISIESMMEIEERNAVLSGVDVISHPVRDYVAGSTAAHIIGYTGKISSTEYETKKEQGYSLNDSIGKTGIEAAFEEYLRGVNGSKRLEMDSYGRISNEEEIEESSIGHSIVLTLDLDLQAMTEKVLKEMVLKIQNGGFSNIKYDDARAGAAVVMDVKTGEVLALASYPTFNPEEFVDGISNKEYSEYFNNEDKPMFNRAIQGTYPPGSTFKMITGIAALESNTISVKDYVNDTGVFYLGHKPACWIWNSRRQVHGKVNAETALKVSCNYYYYEVASKMGIDTIAEYARKFGLGQKTGIELLGEVSGTVSSREYVDKLNSRPNATKRTWTIGDTLSSAIGQSYNSFTPLQMCYYLATLANKGVKNEVTIIKEVLDSDGKVVDKNEIQEKINAKLNITEQDLTKIEIQDENLKAIFEGMKSVTGDSGGTAYGTFSSFPIEVAGKTGTATAGSGSDNAWFVGFAPYDDPEIAVVVIVEHGGHGYYTAQAVKSIMEEYFGYNNDVNEDLGMTTVGVKIVE